ncbi:purine/pyrimidine permease [Shimazuella sp. AN120528]|uniref:purine/pyrimidine permease n=1 Tax=Shimazuella soli TaxID=1892854 RepID=UPI001F0FD298|nr:purine/pyrimidine permease [Shimazuella soli]MCH5584501.1 purine/pyrimidine permease [Shimazuella soli]
MSYSLRSLQWFIFLIANGLAVPIVIGQLYHLSPIEVAEFIQRTFFVIGISTFLQVAFGHRLPLIDGPAGIWLGVFVVMGQIAANKNTLHSLTGMLAVAGIVLMIFGFTGLLSKMLVIFTSLVTSTFLVLLSLQLSGVFLKGMLGITSDITYFPLKEAAVAFFIFVLVFVLSMWGKGWMKTYNVLIGIALGWICFLIIGAPNKAVGTHAFFSIPQVFAWGIPQFDLGGIVSGILIGLVLMSNTVASITALNQVIPKEQRADKKELNQSGWIGGISHLVSTIFSTIGMVSLTVTAGFVKTTNQTKTNVLKIACIALVILSCFPPIMSLLSQLPSQIAYAAILPSFAQMFAIGIRTLLNEKLDDRRVTIFSLSVSLGIGIMFLPLPIFQKFPSVVQYIFGNGLLVGVIIVILLDQLWRKKIM